MVRQYTILHGDVDTLIVNCAIQIAWMHGQEVNVVADDTDTLILLTHHWRDSMADVYNYYSF